MVYIAVMGHGVVGSGVVEVFYKNNKSILARAGVDMDIKYVLDLREFPDLPYSDKFIKDFNIILNDDTVKIVVEVMGGLHPAYEFVKSCLEKGKSVVTSNKALVAAFGAELLAIAREHNANFLFEASVGGGIPILRPISQCLAANELKEIAGILNGTTNFILTKMIAQGMPFDEALALAQKLGYAERDPSADVGGADACRKICILASLAFGRHVYPEDVQTEGITKLSLLDVKYAAAYGCVIKLIGRVKKLDDGRISALVSPAFLKKESQLANVDDVFNGIMVRGDAIGDVVFYGRGAGKLPTASAVVADIIDEAKHLGARKYVYWQPAQEGYVLPPELAKCAFFVRVTASDRAPTLKAVSNLFGRVTEIVLPNGPENEVAFVTPELAQGEFERALAALSSLDIRPVSHIRVMEDL